RPTPVPALFPYTTLFRSHLPGGAYLVMIGYGAHEPELRTILDGTTWGDKVRFLGRVEPDMMLPLTAGADVGVIPYLPIDLNHKRSEEHTSERQSPDQLVC